MYKSFIKFSRDEVISVDKNNNQDFCDKIIKNLNYLKIILEHILDLLKQI